MSIHDIRLGPPFSGSSEASGPTKDELMRTLLGMMRDVERALNAPIPRLAEIEKQYDEIRQYEERDEELERRKVTFSIGPIKRDEET